MRMIRASRMKAAIPSFILDEQVCLFTPDAEGKE